ncbi:RNA polymerase II-associated protein RBA50 [Golovinomyces cichoracearum]|uniref:RNA polymerase II-associated protein RBA50 n=1 Tax=Golovinomyces cichoracearum TaxID=62708 RepID=A0A420IDI7_9PEZI|nr:RNA polymerase II-associated protein RBA50 [Golovinomyces cichoracearum]
MAINLQGQRFEIDLSDEEDNSTLNRSSQTDLIRDIKERSISNIASTPTLTNHTSSGFPSHKKRFRTSTFKQKRNLIKSEIGHDVSAISPESQVATSIQEKLGSHEIEKQCIDEENRQRLSDMTTEEIEEEKREILSQLDPLLIEKLLKRANLDEARGDTGIEESTKPELQTNPTFITETTKQDSQPVDSAQGVPAPRINGNSVASRSVKFVDEEQEPSSPIGLQPASKQPIPAIDYPKIHFPAAPSVPDLDPSDPSFLENLHAKYFPSLPADPSKLAWMAPIPTHGSIEDQKSSYFPAQSSLPASALRFNFRGGILPPRIARAVPVTKGLHHHGEAPEAAGYTIPELAHLSRSVYPAQRCIAFQTLGRILYRLGRGEWGKDDSDITMGIWKCMTDGRIISTLKSAASAEGGHQGCKAYSVEAIWLWQKGGGKECEVPDKNLSPFQS